MSNSSHPSREQLERLAQDDLDEPDLQPVARHVEECETCQAFVSTVAQSEFGEKLRALAAPVNGRGWGRGHLIGSSLCCHVGTDAGSLEETREAR